MPSILEQIARDIREGTFPKKSEATLREEMDMPKRPNRRVPPESEMIPPQEERAADRLPEPESYPTNNFALTALILGGLIVVIGLAYVTGMIKP
jgi:hypothetical protein